MSTIESFIEEKDVKSRAKKLIKKKMKDSVLEIKFAEDILPPTGEDDLDE